MSLQELISSSKHLSGTWARWIEFTVAKPTTDPRVDAHIWTDGLVTAARLSAFGNAPHDVQLLTLARLRQMGASGPGDMYGVVVPLMLAYAIYLFEKYTRPEPSGALLSGWAFFLSVLWDIIIVLPVFVTTWQYARDRSNRRGIAAVWVPAFEGELSRRFEAKGKQAREWQRERSHIDWG